jgi:hypothetical protein
MVSLGDIDPFGDVSRANLGVVRGDKSASSLMHVNDGVESWDDIISGEENNESVSVLLLFVLGDGW